MKLKIYLQDLKDEWLPRVYDVLRYEMEAEINEAIEAGIPKETAAAEIVDHYLNTHNFGWDIEL